MSTICQDSGLKSLKENFTVIFKVVKSYEIINSFCFCFFGVLICNIELFWVVGWKFDLSIRHK